jgi:hypothetical protein
VGSCGLDSSGSGQGSLAVSCEHGNEPSVSQSVSQVGWLVGWLVS